MLAQLNDCIGGLLHLGPNVITFRTLLHLGQLLHLGLQQTFHGLLLQYYLPLTSRLTPLF